MNQKSKMFFINKTGDNIYELFTTDLLQTFIIRSRWINFEINDFL